MYKIKTKIKTKRDEGAFYRSVILFPQAFLVFEVYEFECCKIKIELLHRLKVKYFPKKSSSLMIIVNFQHEFL